MKLWSWSPALKHVSMMYRDIAAELTLCSDLLNSDSGSQQDAIGESHLDRSSLDDSFKSIDASWGSFFEVKTANDQRMSVGVYIFLQNE